GGGRPARYRSPVGLLLTALALAVRLVWVLVVPTRPVGDFAMYLESARYLCEHHALDPAFIYMPGYVFLAAGVYAFGGGLLAVKMIGVAAGGLATAAAYGTARAVFGRAQPPPIRRVLPDRQSRRPHRARGGEPRYRRALQPIAQSPLRRGDGLRAVRRAAPRLGSRRLCAGQAVDRFLTALRARAAGRQGRSLAGP